MRRWVPGVQVARADANKWAVSARGFNGRFATKLLVLVDGRSVYSPLFSGVFWELQDLMLEDVERIEVVRGQTYRIPILEPPYQRPVDEDTRRTGGHLLACWQRAFDSAADLRLDSVLRYVGPLPSQGIGRYLELDLRLAWQPRSDLEIALAGRNLLRDHHPEFQPTLVDILATETRRSGHAAFTWSF